MTTLCNFRAIDLKRRVRIYRNTSPRYRKEHIYSVLQDGRVVAHVSSIMLYDVRFIVSEAGRQRVLRTGHKNVHAFISGFISDEHGGMGTDHTGKLPAKITYNPRVMDTFCWGTQKLLGARCVILNQHGVTGAYLE